MSPAFRDLEVVMLSPKPGARDELLAIREKLIAEYSAAYEDRFEATLSEVSESAWVDVWRWSDRADAEHALAHRELIPSFALWEQRVDLASITWARVIA